MANELTTNLAQVPAHLQPKTGEGTGLEHMQDYLTPPRLKVVQRNAQPPYCDLFNAGDTIITPQNLLICPKDGHFNFTPLYSYSEFCIVNPFQLRNKLGMIEERTLDPQSDLAQKARAFHSEEVPGEKFERKWMTFLNFIVVLHDSPVGNMPVLMSFSGGEYRSGSSALTLMTMRGVKFYGCNFSAAVSEHSNTSYQWMGWDIQNPADVPPYVEDPELFAQYEKQYEMYAANRSKLKADYEDGDSTPAEDSEF